MTPLLSRRRLAVAGAAATVSLGAIGGTVLAVHGSSSPATGAVAATTSPTPTPSPPPGKKHAKHAHGAPAELALGRVTGTTPTTLTYTDHKGTSHAVTVGAKTRILDANGKAETLSQLPNGELVVVSVAHQQGKHGAGATSSPTLTPTPTASTPSMAVAIRDTGFAAK